MSEPAVAVRLFGPEDVPPVPEAHRLTLSEGAWSLLLELVPVVLPPEFGGTNEPTPGDRDPGAAAASQGWDLIARALQGGVPSREDAWAELRRCGAAVPHPHSPDGPDVPSAAVIHPSVLANLAVLGCPRFLVRVEAVVPVGRRLALTALAGDLGASLVLLPGGVELSLFDPVVLAGELARLVPPIDVDAGADLGEGVLARFPLREVHVPVELAREETGFLFADVLSVVPASVPVRACLGRVGWLASTSGWIGVRAVPDGSADQPVHLLAACAEDLPRWLAPLIAAALDATGPPPGPTPAEPGAHHRGEL